ncbi:chemerin-like receptor 1 isoform X2 [Neoarius graeffei]|uniref:chemerin-like receptor 1 isoform X2 n=1 Tax=Neoarius graeffei TaxID=443677 RepID=UPI00298C59D2|nr:chemerin-like receptor 1 isoform X2 [Neoarius graeffei]
MSIYNFTMETTDFTLNYGYDYANYTADNLTDLEEHFVHPICSGELLCLLLLVVNVIIIVLGIVGNGVVIWIAGFKMKKTVNTTWFTSFVMFLNMFSSIFLLVIISVDRCMVVMFPVWAQNQRTIRKASLIVLLAWVLSVSLSMPSTIFRDVQEHLGRTRCHNNYPNQHIHKSIGICRFIFGFLIPFLVIIVCYSVIIFKLRSNQMTKSTKPFKIMTALIGTFFICWLPYHTFVLAELNHSFSNIIIMFGFKIGTSVASANSFLNPILYVFMGNDFRQKFKNSILSKIENAIGEEGRTMSRYLSRSSSMDARASTHI